jgi:signal peptidase II
VTLRRRSPRGWLFLSLLVLLLDQISKYLVTRYFQLHESLALLPGLKLTLVHNTGAAFSFLRDAGGWQRWLFIILGGLVGTAVVLWLSRIEKDRHWALPCALALILGGIAGNLVDRAMLGYVVDFIDVYYRSWHWPTFNVADSAISIGAVLLVVDAIWLDRAHVSTHDGSRDRS